MSGYKLDESELGGCGGAGEPRYPTRRGIALDDTPAHGLIQGFVDNAKLD